MRDPSFICDPGDGVPNPIPVQAEALGVVRHLTVGSGPCRIHFEKETVPVVEERIEDDQDPVVDVEFGIARQLCRHDVARRSVVAENADIQGAVRVEHPHVGVLRRFAAFHRLALHESTDRRRALPGCLVELSIHANRLGAPGGDGANARRLLRLVRGSRCGREHEQQCNRGVYWPTRHAENSGHVFNSAVAQPVALSV